MPVQEGEEGGAVQPVELTVAQRDDGRRSRGVGDQPHFADQLPRANARNDGCSGFALNAGRKAAIDHKVEGV